MPRCFAELVDRFAATLGVSPGSVVSPSGRLRLLDQRPDTAHEVCATAGVTLPKEAAEQAAGVLAQ